MSDSGSTVGLGSGLSPDLATQPIFTGGASNLLIRMPFRILCQRAKAGTCGNAFKIWNAISGRTAPKLGLASKLELLRLELGRDISHLSLTHNTMSIADAVILVAYGFVAVSTISWLWGRHK